MKTSGTWIIKLNGKDIGITVTAGEVEYMVGGKQGGGDCYDLGDIFRTVENALERVRVEAEVQNARIIRTSLCANSRADHRQN